MKTFLCICYSSVNSKQKVIFQLIWGGREREPARVSQDIPGGGDERGWPVWVGLGEWVEFLLPEPGINPFSLQSIMEIQFVRIEQDITKSEKGDKRVQITISKPTICARNRHTHHGTKT